MDEHKGYLLVVEDIPDILNLLETTLKFKGYRVTTAQNGEEALAQIKKEHPALIIADILMPKMDGFSLVHYLRIHPSTRNIPVVFLSATYVTPEDKDFAISIGVNRFIEKPVDLAVFLPIVDRLMKHGAQTHTQSLSDAEFYEGYLKRLENKLIQKNAQIARDERLLGSLTDDEKPAIDQSLQRALDEREEIQHLLGQVREQFANASKKDSS